MWIMKKIHLLIKENNIKRGLMIEHNFVIFLSDMKNQVDVEDLPYLL